MAEPVTQLPVLDQDGHLQDHQCWTPEIAVAMAALDGVELTEPQIQILLLLRRFYVAFDHAPMTRPLIAYLRQNGLPDTSNTGLMAQFQTGKVARTLARYAGLPKPPNCL